MELFTGKQQRKRAYRLAIIGMALLGVGIWIAVFNPLQMIIDYKLTMRPGSLLFNLWQKPPLEVFISVYVFNITNFDRFMRGEDTKLKLQEVGPYVYQEFLENHNATFNDNNTLTFRPHRKVEFIREKSVGDPKTDVVFVPNIPYMGVTTAASKISIFAAAAVRALMRTLKSEVMLNVTVHDYFWGYEDPLVRLASTFVPGIIHFETFGLLDRMFDEGENLVTINLPRSKGEETTDPTDNEPVTEALKMNMEYSAEDGLFNEILKEFKKFKPTKKEQAFGKPYEPPIRDFSIDTWNGQAGLSYWGYKEGKNPGNTECNTLRGAYDATLFPKNISKGEMFRVYRKPFCRTLPIVYSHPGEVDGIDAYFFKLADNAFDSSFNDSSTSCFCDKVCLKKGLGNITPCYYTIPAAVSFPHFYNGDPSLLNSVDGLNPSEEKHGTEIVLQPQLGVPMKVHSRLQINLLMGDVKLNADMKKFRDTVLPIIWFEIAVESLTPSLLLLVQLLFNICPYVQIAAIYVLIIAGISIMGLSGLTFFCGAGKPTAKPFNPKKDLKYSPMLIIPFMRKDFDKFEDGEQERLADSA